MTIEERDGLMELEGQTLPEDEDREADGEIEDLDPDGAAEEALPESEPVPQTKDDAAELWERYYATKSQDCRNDLVLHYSGLVKFIASRMRGVYKNYAQMDDVVNQGIIALIDAVEKYDPQKNIKFETFASIKVKGAVIDFIRSQDWVPRRLRKLSGDLDEATSRLYTDLGRQPTHAEIAKEMQLTTEQLDRVMEQTYNFNLLSYEEVVWQKMSAMGDEIQADIAEEQPEQNLMDNELRQQLAASLDRLNERERTVISLYYYEKLKLKEIAEVLGVSESRVCQIHSSSILKMKKTMKDYITN